MVVEAGFASSVTKVVIPDIRWDGNGQWVVDVGAGTETLTMDGGNLMKSSCKSPDVFPWIATMCEANTVHICVINCETTIIVKGMKCI